MADGTGSVTLPLHTLSASGIDGEVGTGSITFLEPVITGVQGLTGTVGVGAVELTEFAIPGASLEGPMALQEMTLSATGIAGVTSSASISLPVMSASGAGLSGPSAVGDIDLPQMSLSATTGAEGDIELPALTLSGTIGSGRTMSAAVTLPSMTASGTMLQDTQSVGEIVLRAPTVDAVMGSSIVASGSIRLEELRLNATIGTGNTATADITLPLFELSATGMMDAVGTAVITLPFLQLYGEMEQSLSGLSSATVVMNTRNRAITNYSGIAANSLCQFNGLLLAATEDGIVALTGDTDLGDDIEASVSAGVSDLGSQQRKRVLSAYVGYRADGDMEMTMITDDHHEYIYTLAPRNMDDQHASRVKFGRGADGRYWQWKLSNKDGSDFAIDSISFDVSQTSKRV